MSWNLEGGPLGICDKSFLQSGPPYDSEDPAVFLAFYTCHLFVTRFISSTLLRTDTARYKIARKACKQRANESNNRVLFQLVNISLGQDP